MTLHGCSDAASPGEGPGVLWQGEWNAANTAVVLECVLARVGARELWMCGAVCRAWRRAAADSALWRRLLLPHATPDTLRALAALNVTNGRSDWSWRKEYALEKAHWESCDHVLPPSGGSASLLCAALHGEGNYLALVDEDSRLTIYEHVRPKLRLRREVEWRIQWSDVVKTEWRSISWAQWAPSTPRLLLAGRLALADRYEMLCIQFDDEWCSTVVCRSASGPGGAGCWVDDTNFLSLRLQLLAPGHACTTVWLNAASQETYSEFAGITAPLLRIYNEASTHISHVLVANVPKLEDDNNMFGNNSDINTCREPNASYYKSLQKGSGDGETKQILIGAGGVPGGERGVAEAVLAWALPALELPILWVEDHLAQRVQQHRLRLQAVQQQPDHEPDIEIMRALCTPPVSSCCLFSRILGIVIHPKGGCLWATTETGATCLSLPALSPLLRLPRYPSGAVLGQPLLPPHYIIPSVNDDFFISPAGGGSGCVDVWTCRSGRGAGQLQHRSPALAVFLLPQRHFACRILVLTVNAIHVVRRLSNRVNSGVHGRRSCAPVEVQECTPCPQIPKPECREAPSACPRGLRVVCCPPSPGARPPCSPPLSSSPLTCTDVKLWETTNNTKTCNSIKSKGNNTNVCGTQLDRVAHRIEAAKRARRIDYEREVSTKDIPKVAITAPSVSYKLAGERECMRATDGRDYAVTITQNKMNHCDPSRNPPPPCPVNLEPIDRCEVNRERHLDPCSHQPRIFLEIDRSSHSTEPCKQSTASLTTRIIESLKRSGSVSPRQACGLPCAEGGAKNYDRNSWCNKLPTPKSVPPYCKEPSITERLRRRPGGSCGESCNPHRQLHTKINLYGYKSSACSSEITDKQKKANLDKVASIMQEKSNLKEAGQGRVVTSHEKNNKNHNIGGGGLELKVPPSTDAVRVRVLLEFNSTEPRNCKTDSIFEAIDTANISSFSSSNGTEPWLSLKNLQQKLSGRRKSETAQGTKKSIVNDNSPKQSLKGAPSASSSACPPGNSPSNPMLCPRPSQSKQKSPTSPPLSQSPCPPRDSENKSKFVSTQDQVQFC